jgi:hypothetical protein
MDVSIDPESLLGVGSRSTSCGSRHAARRMEELQPTIGSRTVYRITVTQASPADRESAVWLDGSGRPVRNSAGR